MNLVSIIVPIYNVENYIESCVKSILSQTYKNIEILLIDDGSTDLSGKIIDEISATDKRIKVHHLQNSGVANARNYGIKCANGVYLAFADSDDLMSPYFVEDAVEAIKNADYVSAAFQTISEKTGLNIIDYMVDWGDIVTSNDYLREMIKYQAGAYWGANWGKLYITDIVKKNNIQFEQGVNFAEDFRFNLEYLMNVKTIAVLHHPEYYYRIDTAGSLSKKSREPLIYWEEYKKLCNRYIKLYNYHGILEKERQGISKLLIGAYVSVLRECACDGKMKIKDIKNFCWNLDRDRSVQDAAKMCSLLSGKIGIYSKLIAKKRGKWIAVALKISKIIKR